MTNRLKTILGGILLVLLSMWIVHGAILENPIKSMSFKEFEQEIKILPTTISCQIIINEDSSREDNGYCFDFGYINNDIDNYILLTDYPSVKLPVNTKQPMNLKATVEGFKVSISRNTYASLNESVQNIFSMPTTKDESFFVDTKVIFTDYNVTVDREKNLVTEKDVKKELYKSYMKTCTQTKEAVKISSILYSVGIGGLTGSVYAFVVLLLKKFYKKKTVSLDAQR